jgi:hypothetical protein
MIPAKNTSLYRIIIPGFTLLVSFTISSCSSPPGMYIDLSKQAIVSCDGEGINEIKIESDSGEVTLEGTPSVIYLNKKNEVARTSIYGETVGDIVLNLKPNCNYMVSKHMGADRGDFRVSFKTDASGNITTTTGKYCP